MLFSAIKSKVLLVLCVLTFVYANTEIWRFNPSDIGMQDTTNRANKEDNLIHPYTLQPLKINTVKVRSSSLSLQSFNIPISIPINSTTSRNNIYLKLSWSAIDPVQSFQDVSLHHAGINLLYLNMDILLSHEMNYTEEHPLLMNLYIDDTGSLITHDLYPIVAYITVIVLILVAWYITFGGIEQLLNKVC